VKLGQIEGKTGPAFITGDDLFRAGDILAALGGGHDCCSIKPENSFMPACE
jgi:hypothetical protein